METMNNAVNSKRVFCVVPHRPIGYGEMLGKRGDVRLDMLEQDSPDGAAMEVLSAAHAYQISSARDELARHYHVSADLLSKTPNLLIVSTNGAGYDTVDVKDCTERGVLVVNQVRRQRRSGRRACARHDAVPGQAGRRMRSRAARRHAGRPQRLSPATKCSARPSASSASAMSAGASPNCAAGCFACRCWPTIPISSAEEIARARRDARSSSTNCCARADFVSVNCPLTDETRKMIGGARICADAAARLFHHHGARLHSRRGGAGSRRCATRRSPAPASTSGTRSRRRPIIR